MIRLIALVVLFSLAPALTFADAWPQFLGPNRDATTDGSTLLTQWPSDGPKTLWTVEMGPGFGGAAIAHGQVFVLDRMDDKGDALRVLDLKTGKEQWRFAYDAEGRLSYHGSRSTPTVTDKHIYTVGGFGDVHCISRETKQPVWHFNLTKRYKFDGLKWGHAQSPLVIGDKLILTPTGADTPALIAVNRMTGAVIWESGKPNMTPGRQGDNQYASDYYSSPMLRTIAGREGILQITNHQVGFFDIETGRTIWTFNNYAIKFAIPSPTVLPSSNGGKSNLVFITGGYDDGSVMIRVTKTGDGYKTEQVWRPSTDGIPDGSQIHPAVHHDGYLYAVINENSKFRRSARERGGLACIDPNTGKIVWRTGDAPFFSRGSLIKVGDHLLVQEGERGTLHLVSPSPKGYQEVARTQILNPNDDKQWAAMAYAGGLLIMRDQKQMKCVDLRGPQASE